LSGLKPGPISEAKATTTARANTEILSQNRLRMTS
jgi:hypothetical protein